MASNSSKLKPSEKISLPFPTKARQNALVARLGQIYGR